ncbi:hypothetical protein GV51_0261 [Gardnerella vaginalis 5-1]|nr:hypothetical protein GV51_0261 [Gardnerella vaginalis 5-1]
MTSTMTLEKICVNIFLVLWLKGSIWIKVMHKSTILLKSLA